MSYRKAKSAPKSFESDPKKLKKIVLDTMKSISDIVSSTLGPGGRNVLIESDLPNVPPKNTKDGVTVFKSLGHMDSYVHLIIEQARDAAVRTCTEAGDGPQPLYSKILTPKGFVTMGDIKIGDEICGTDGTIQKVIGVFPKGTKEIYEVEIANRGIVQCCKDHLWSVIYDKGKESILTTEMLSKDFLIRQKNGYNEYKYYTPKTFVEFQQNDLEMPLDSYLVGVLLGDGCLRESGSIEISLGKKKEHVIEKIKLSKGFVANAKFVDNKNYFRVKINGIDENGKSIKDIVKSIGLFNTTSHTKFIPKSYLYASKSVRESLLQGLLDTDGHINTKGLFEYSTVSPELAKDFTELVLSLGKSIYSRIQTRSTEEGAYSNTPIYKICELKGYKYGNKIINITPTGKFTEMQCIKVSNPNNLYITDNYVVTHNTTSATILSYTLIQNIFDFCERYPKYSPQKAIRRVKKMVQNTLIPYINERAIKIDESNKSMLKMVAKVSANGDGELADAVIQAFEEIGYGANSHVTIRDVSGPPGFKVERIDGFPIPIGLESIGKMSVAFINDQANQRCYLEKPLFLLFDGHLNDLMSVLPLINSLGEKYVNEGKSDYKNLVIFAHGFSENVLTQLAFNFADPITINVVPIMTPMAQFINSQTHFLMDLSAFTGARVFGFKDQVNNATIQDLGGHMESFESYRFRSTAIGDPDPTNIEVRAEDLRKMKEQAESKAETLWLEERIGKITNGIAKLTVFGGSNVELKEICDRVEDAVCSVRSAITHGALPGGCRISIDMSLKLAQELEEGDPAREILIPALMSLPQKLLDNAGYSHEETQEVIRKLIEDPDLVYDIENEQFGKAEELGLFDATKAVSESLSNAVSIAGVLGTMGGIVAQPRDLILEREESRADSEFMKAVDNPNQFVNEANDRP